MPWRLESDGGAVTVPPPPAAAAVGPAAGAVEFETQSQVEKMEYAAGTVSQSMGGLVDVGGVDGSGRGKADQCYSAASQDCASRGAHAIARGGTRESRQRVERSLERSRQLLAFAPCLSCHSYMLHRLDPVAVASGSHRARTNEDAARGSGFSHGAWRGRRKKRWPNGTEGQSMPIRGHTTSFSFHFWLSPRLGVLIRLRLRGSPTTTAGRAGCRGGGSHPAPSSGRHASLQSE